MPMLQIDDQLVKETVNALFAATVPRPTSYTNGLIQKLQSLQPVPIKEPNKQKNPKKTASTP